jgi:acetamidase/formamidase
MDTKTPADTGGSMDWEGRAALVYSPSQAGCSDRDPHALQGDGEIGGRGIECVPMFVAAP